MTSCHADDPREALARCVGDPDRFVRDHFGRGPHLHRGPTDADDLLSLDAVDHITATMALRQPAFRLVRNGQSLPASSYTASGTIGGRPVGDLIDVGKVHEHVRQGATLVLQGLHRYWEPVARFCRSLELVLTQPVQANAYLTPPVATGLNVHHDTHDVFVLQTYGTKQWVVYEPVVEQPLTSQRWSGREHQPGPATMELELRPGDCLYLPRGTPHAARTIGIPSLHLTVGIRSATWHDLFRQLLDGASEEVSFREALPAGYAHDPEVFATEVTERLKALGAWIQNQDAAEVAARAASRFWSSRSPLLAGHLRDLLESDQVGDDTVVVRRAGSVCRLRVEGDRLTVQLGDRQLTMPAAAGPALHRLAEAGPTRVGELADLLDEESRRVLVRRLITEGLLAVDRG